MERQTILKKVILLKKSVTILAKSKVVFASLTQNPH